MKIFVVIICAIISDIKAQNTFRGHQVPGWQNRDYQTRQIYNGKKPYHEPPAASLKPPFVPQEIARKNIPLITESPYKSQPNYGFTPRPPLTSSSKATIIKQEYERHPDGGYRFFYETSDGSSREEVGFFRQHAQLGKVLTVHGSYGYIAPNKKKIFVKYTADERGYRAETLNHPPVHLPSNVINSQLGYLKN